MSFAPSAGVPPSRLRTAAPRRHKAAKPLAQIQELLSESGYTLGVNMRIDAVLNCIRRVFTRVWGWIIGERRLLVGLSIAAASMCVVLYVQLPMELVSGGLRVFVGADCGERLDVIAVLSPGSQGSLAGQFKFAKPMTPATEARPPIQATQCHSVRLQSSHAVKCLSLDPSYRNCLAIRPSAFPGGGRGLEYLIQSDELARFRGELFVDFGIALERESLSERTLAATIGALTSPDESNAKVLVGVNVPWPSAVTLLLGLQTATLENGTRLIFGPDPRQPVTSVRMSLENRDLRNLGALVILLASTVLGVGASVIASRFFGAV